MFGGHRRQRDEGSPDNKQASSASHRFTLEQPESELSHVLSRPTEANAIVQVSLEMMPGWKKTNDWAELPFHLSNGSLSWFK